MFDLPVEDLVFLVCTVVGGGLLLITVLLDDILGGLLDAAGIHFDIGGMSLMPLALSFISMFGVGGLFATRVLDLHGGPAAVVGAVSGLIGAGIAFVLFRAFQRSEAEPPFTMADLTGSDAIVAVTIRSRGWGSILVRAQGQRHEVSATAAEEITAGTPVRITGAVGTGVSVEPLTPVATGGSTPQAPTTDAPAAPANADTTSGS
jgi:membrane protein implicated in regulation of membrane protease activity